MTQKIKVKILILSVFCFSCSFDKNSNAANANQDKQQIVTIQIQLFPAFNNSSCILIDKASKKIYFRVDTTIKFRGVMPHEYISDFDSFEKNTLIDSFYSSSFLDSIKSKSKHSVVLDGLSIYTIVNRQNQIDTIFSRNVYPKYLSTNIMSQLNYISKSTKDALLKNYIEDLKTYFQ